MTENLDILDAAVSLLIRAALLAATHLFFCQPGKHGRDRLRLAPPVLNAISSNSIHCEFSRHKAV